MVDMTSLQNECELPKLLDISNLSTRGPVLYIRSDSHPGSREKFQECILPICLVKDNKRGHEMRKSRRLSRRATVHLDKRLLLYQRERTVAVDTWIARMYREFYKDLDAEEQTRRRIKEREEAERARRNQVRVNILKQPIRSRETRARRNQVRVNILKQPIRSRETRARRNQVRVNILKQPIRSRETRVRRSQVRVNILKQPIRSRETRVRRNQVRVNILKQPIRSRETRARRNQVRVNILKQPIRSRETTYRHTSPSRSN